MARILIEVGSLSSEKQVTDAKAQRTLNGYIKSKMGGLVLDLPEFDNMTDQERLDMVISELSKDLVRLAKSREIFEAERGAKESIEANPPSFE